MDFVRQTRCLLPLAVAAAMFAVGAPHAGGQLLDPLSSSRYELAETIQLDRAESTAAADFQRVQAYLADRQWDEAVETLRAVMENSANKLWGVTERRYVSVRDYCHLQLATLPPEAREKYRSRVDPLAEKWYEQGVARGDRRLLLKVVEQAFASSWGDDALAALGEMALESGDCAAARSYWEKIIPAEPPAGASKSWLCFPDTDLELAAIRARLVLVSILEGSPRRAADELAAFERLHGTARGRLGGREVEYAEALAALLGESRAWPRDVAGDDWPTFAGSPGRNRIAAEIGQPVEVAWRIPLPQATLVGRPGSTAAGAIGRVAEDAHARLSFHPVSVGNLLFVGNQAEILAIDSRTGKAAWGPAGTAAYRDQLDSGLQALKNPPDSVGLARFTMTAFEGKLYARMGPAVTSRPRTSMSSGSRGYLVCLDLEAEGRLLWKIEPEDDAWAFEGSPVTDGAGVYVAMRRSEIHPQAHVACFDAASGRRRWRSFVCGAETPARGILHESTHNLLTLERDTLYYNTNLGAVAAVSTHQGRVKWVSLYRRARRGNLLKPAPHTSRDLNPCLYHRGTLLVAPQDSPRIFALDAAGGQILWQSDPAVQDAVHLLGVVGDQLIASGHKLYWISLKREDAGRIRQFWPDGHERLGYGRGILSGDRVFWPTRKSIYVFDQATATLNGEIQLVPHGAGGGNLLVAGGRLLIATPSELIALGRGGPQPPKDRALTTAPFPEAVQTIQQQRWGLALAGPARGECKARLLGNDPTAAIVRRPWWLGCGQVQGTLR